ncbi:MAG: Rab geranylgeranyltransferase [Claussenomyces sp. TS43310]|nr:MAG: Rab geranylgeranyltransferase [Claussenomyces sp. TS43310]
MASHGISRTAAVQQRSAQQREDELLQIATYRSLVDLVESKIAERQYTAEVLQLTSKLLTKNPEYYTIWNARRRLLIYGLFSKSLDLSLPSTASPSTSPTNDTKTSSDGSSSSTARPSEDSSATPADQDRLSPGKNGTILDLIQADLNFVVPLLKKWPKCYWIWNYRIWLLQQATQRLDVAVARTLWQGELALVSVMLVRDSRNYHGWGYRRIVVEQLESSALNGSSMVESEFAYTTKMISAHLSNFSAWHARSKLIPRLLDERKADDTSRKTFLDDGMFYRPLRWHAYSSDQSLWFYYEFLMTSLVNPAWHATIVPNFSHEKRIAYVERQLVDLAELLDGAEDCKWIYNALLEYTLALSRMQERGPSEEERLHLRSWLSELRNLDRLRSGRWDALEKSIPF